MWGLVESLCCCLLPKVRWHNKKIHTQKHRCIVATNFSPPRDGYNWTPSIRLLSRCLRGRGLMIQGRGKQHQKLLMLQMFSQPRRPCWLQSSPMTKPTIAHSSNVFGNYQKLFKLTTPITTPLKFHLSSMMEIKAPLLVTSLMLAILHPPPHRHQYQNQK